uniref:TITAN-like protein n=1 Tax=Manihot esculenta TaxID=3983 RepID=A0A2C9UJX9_MANES
MNQKIDSANKTNNNKKKKSEFEFCKVCNLNQEQGHRHKYFPSHKKSLSSFLSRFQSKLVDIRFFLKNPSVLRREHASRNRFWCVFCDTDIHEIDSSFACANAINHLASEDHAKNLKHFLWKYGGEMNHMDTYRILEADITKWEKKCKSLENEAASSNGSNMLQVGPSNDIQNELNHKYRNNFESYSFDPTKSNISNGVMPLLYFTNKNQISHSELSAVTKVGSIVHDTVSSIPADVWNSNDLTGLQNITQTSATPGKAGGNVHTGAPPPWLEATEETQLVAELKPISSSFISLSNKPGKKLNPKRVGAAWAERRKIELEMERRGEIVKSDGDDNWLPNFGRVWQSGTRKESRKEFEMEKQKLPKVESQSEMPIKIEPYISKRMRRDASE